MLARFLPILFALCGLASGVGFLAQNTAVTVRVGPFVDSTDGATIKSALTIVQGDVFLSKNDGAGAQKSASGTASYDSKGCYLVSLSTTDTNTLGNLHIDIQATGALPVWAD